MTDSTPLPGLPVKGDRVRDVDRGIIGTVTGLRSGMSIAVTWDDGHPFSDNPTLALFEDLETMMDSPSTDYCATFNGDACDPRACSCYWQRRAEKAEDECKRWMATYNHLVSEIPVGVLDRINRRPVG